MARGTDGTSSLCERSHRFRFSTFLPSVIATTAAATAKITLDDWAELTQEMG